MSRYIQSFLKLFLKHFYIFLIYSLYIVLNLLFRASWIVLCLLKRTAGININLHANHYFQADRNGPQFQTVFNNTEQMIQVSVCRF